MRCHAWWWICVGRRRSWCAQPTRHARVRESFSSHRCGRHHCGAGASHSSTAARPSGGTAAASLPSRMSALSCDERATTRTPGATGLTIRSAAPPCTSTRQLVTPQSRRGAHPTRLSPATTTATGESASPACAKAASSQQQRPTAAPWASAAPSWALTTQRRWVTPPSGGGGAAATGLAGRSTDRRWAWASRPRRTVSYRPAVTARARGGRVRGQNLSPSKWAHTCKQRTASPRRQGAARERRRQRGGERLEDGGDAPRGRRRLPQRGHRTQQLSCQADLQHEAQHRVHSHLCSHAGALSAGEQDGAKEEGVQATPSGVRRG